MAKKQVKFDMEPEDYKLVQEAVRQTGGSLADFGRNALLSMAGKPAVVAPAVPEFKVEPGSKYSKSTFSKSEKDNLAELIILMSRRQNELFDLSRAQLLVTPQILALLGQIQAEVRNSHQVEG